MRPGRRRSDTRKQPRRSPHAKLAGAQAGEGQGQGAVERTKPWLQGPDAAVVTGFCGLKTKRARGERPLQRRPRRRAPCSSTTSLPVRLVRSGPYPSIQVLPPPQRDLAPPRAPPCFGVILLINTGKRPRVFKDPKQVWSPRW
jgi:hypothetical protein